MNSERWKQVGEVFGAALELAPDERPGFLDFACGSDAELRKEVESLLHSDEAAGSFLGSVAEDAPRDHKGSDGADPWIGRQIGQYRIVERIGIGGMGMVYRAEDIRLGRSAALKFLSAEIERDLRARERFEREARAASALNHPNICTVYGVDEFEGHPYLAMELLKGGTLGELIQGKPLEVDRLLELAIPIASALDAAHTEGIIHRDLKPGNIFLTDKGQVKILDFGLAKQTALAAVHGGVAESPEAATDLTTAGLIIGTVSYMSPEQVRTEKLDGRSDLFSLGAVLYEMATGQQAFPGRLPVLALDAILNRTPVPVSKSNPKVPESVAGIIDKALQKDRSQRYQSAFELLGDLREVQRSGAAVSIRRRKQDSVGRQTRRWSNNPASVPVQPLGTTADKTRWAWVWLTGATVVLLLASGYWYQSRPLPPPRITAYTQITHDGRGKLLGGTDGSRLYFTQFSPNSIAQVGINGGEIAQLPIALSGSVIALMDISPDGSNALISTIWEEGHTVNAQWIVPVLGGAAKRLEDGGGERFSPDGGSVVYSTLNGDIFQVHIDGSDKHKLASVGSAAGGFQWSPDGKIIRFSKADGLWEMSRDGAGIHRLLPGWREGLAGYGRWTPDGSLFVFPVVGGHLWALDERRSLSRQPSSAPIQLTSGPIHWSPPIPGKDGKRIFAVGYKLRGELTRIEPKTGAPQPFLDGISAEYVSFSRDGNSVAYVAFPEGTLWKANRDGSNRMQLTTPSSYQVLNPRWSPDAKQILFTTEDPAGHDAIRRISSADGSPQWLLPEETADMHDANWSPDGTKVVFATGSARAPGKGVVRIVDLNTRQVTVVPGSAGKWSPRWSSNGRYIAAFIYPTVNHLPVFDLKLQRWLDLQVNGEAQFLSFSHDSRFIYFLRSGKEQGVFRIPVTGGKEERVVDMNGWHLTGYFGFSMSLDPTDAPLVLRDTGSSDIYALTLEQK